jgi:hypothetical protein
MTRRKLLRVVEIAEILGVSKQRADQLRQRPDLGSRGPVGGIRRSALGADVQWRSGALGSSLLAGSLARVRASPRLLQLRR